MTQANLYLNALPGIGLPGSSILGPDIGSDELRYVWTVEIEDETSTRVEQLLNMLYDRFQWVSDAHRPPQGYAERSLSVGDVIEIVPNLGEPTIYVCEMVGWRQIEREEVTFLA